MRGGDGVSYKADIHAALDAHPEWGEYGKTRPLYEMFDCARSTIQYYIGTWRKNQAMDIVLPASVEFGNCDECEYRELCKRVVNAGLPMLCEAIERDQQHFYQEQGAWSDVLRSRVEVAVK